MSDFFLIFGAAVFSAIFSYPVWKWCENANIVDNVNARSSHTTPTPRGGGLTFVIPTSLFALAWYAYAEVDAEHSTFILALILGSSALAVLGWLEDKHQLSSMMRLSIQLIIVGVMVWFMPPVFEGLIGFWGDKILLVIAWVWFINLYNFMDGLNTYATAQSIFLCLALVLFASIFKPVLLVLMGTCIGFIRVNITPAKIFMGDVGSLYLGALLGGVLLYQLSIDPSEYFFPLLTLTLVFTFDATYTLIARTLKGKKPWEAHKQHWYQRANQTGFSHEQVTARAIVINFILLIIAVLQWYTEWDVPLFMVALVILAIATKYIKHIENK